VNRRDVARAAIVAVLTLENQRLTAENDLLRKALDEERESHEDLTRRVIEEITN
jgi:regulator of replication initiation timing